MLISSKEQSCAFLIKWPLEIRRLVYHELVVVGSIRHPDELVEAKMTDLVVSNATSRLGIDANILRTCRRIYNETLPMLYGENNFIFRTPSAIETFRDRGLVIVPRMYWLYNPSPSLVKSH